VNERTAFLLLLVGCGDPLVSADYRGEPIFRLTGVIESVGPGAVALGDGEQALVSMFWNTDLSRQPPALVAQDSVSSAITFPSTFEIRVFDPPAEVHLVAADPRFGVGLMLVFVDADADHLYDAGERMIGGNLNKAVVWAHEAVPAEDSPFGAELPEGFSLIDQPFSNCVRPPPFRGGPPPFDGRSHVSLCTTDASCPTGLICDSMFEVCVPKDNFKLTIGNDFDLSRAQCPPS
jgi:hypothetical protein